MGENNLIKNSSGDIIGESNFQKKKIFIFLIAGIIIFSIILFAVLFSINRQANADNFNKVINEVKEQGLSSEIGDSADDDTPPSGGGSASTDSEGGGSNSGDGNSQDTEPEPEALEDQVDNCLQKIESKNCMNIFKEDGVEDICDQKIDSEREHCYLILSLVTICDYCEEMESEELHDHCLSYCGQF